MRKLHNHVVWFSAFISLFYINVLANELTLTWNDNSSDEEGFIIERSSDAGNTYQQVGTVGRNVTYFVDQTISTEVMYRYRVYAFNSFGASNPSNISDHFITMTYTAEDIEEAAIEAQEEVLTNYHEYNLFDKEDMEKSKSVVNVSTRGTLDEGETFTQGFVILGNNQRVLIRAIGEKLQDIGVKNPLVDPRISIYQNKFDGRGPQLIAEKNDWIDEENIEEIIHHINNLGAFPLWSVSNFQGIEMPTNDVTSVATVLTLDSGVYTIIAEGNDGSSGEILLEVYEIDEI
jgi:hypothetical protein